jgi:cytidylate kinase
MVRRTGRLEDAMAVITISRGSFSGGILLAECLGKTLGYRCIDRDVLVARVASRGVSEGKLRAALDTPPRFPGAFAHSKYIYLTLMQAALAEEVCAGDAVYHGMLGHLLLQSGMAVLRVRIIAPMEFRIRMAQERNRLSRSEAIAHIARMDEDRRRWTLYLYGVDWEDPSLYDLVINLDQISIDRACRLIAAFIREAACEFSPEQVAALEDFRLASRVRAELALAPLTSNLEVEVEARRGDVLIKGPLYEQVEEVRRVACAVPGVVSLSCQDVETTTAV